jgi:CxxC motif-containing protein
MEDIKMICVSCPKGCTLTVTTDGDTIVKVADASCKRGEDYAHQEITDPRRMIATTVKVKNGIHPLVPVYTAAPVPKPLIFDILAEIRKAELQAPVKTEQVVIENVLDTGINVIASRDMPQIGN